MSETDKLIEGLYRDKYGQLLSLMLQKFRSLSIESAEDVVQEAFADAAARWTVQSVPQNPAGWLYQACKNKSINLLRRNSRTSDLSPAAPATAEIEEISDRQFHDAQLLMLLACCNPRLTPRMQVVVALKYVANLKVEEIAQQLGSNPDAVEKMLYRARQEVRNESFFTSNQEKQYTRDRLLIAHKVIYLMFTEGYRQPGTNVSRGKDLCEQALLLNTFLNESSHRLPETRALQALMLFNAARFETRFDNGGNAIELEYQDRKLWDRSLIALAQRFLLESEDTSLSPYHLEAAIACVHCSANKFEDTDWGAICRYYEALLNIYPSPFAEINYAVALQYNRQDEKAYRILMDLHQNPYFNKLPLLTRSLEKYYRRTGRTGY